MSFTEFSSYEDVKAALRNPAFWPVAPLKTKNFKVPDAAAQHALRAQVMESFSPAKLSEWQARLDQIELPATVTDLVTDFIEPWCLTAAGLITGAAPADWSALLAEARIVSHAAAEPMDEDLRQWATKADAELARYFRNSTLPMPGPAFVAISRTVACLRANGWLGLLQYPAALQLLRTNPHLLPGAVEEILRYAAVPQSVFRVASAPVTVDGITIAAGERIVLRFASANRDPLVFPDPDRFDPTRRGPAHLSLGFGEHPCAGSALIRLVVTSATAVFVRHFGHTRLLKPVEWEGGSGFRSPRHLIIS